MSISLVKWSDKMVSYYKHGNTYTFCKPYARAVIWFHAYIGKIIDAVKLFDFAGVPVKANSLKTKHFLYQNDISELYFQHFPVVYWTFSDLVSFLWIFMAPMGVNYIEFPICDWSGIKHGSLSLFGLPSFWAKSQF